MTERVLEGGCVCGGVRYRLRGAPIWTNACHCTLCQRSSGSAFGINSIVEAENIDLLSGALVTQDVPTPSGRGQRIHRCASCGTRVWSNFGTPDTIRFLAVGTLDDPAAITPDIHIYTSTKLPWVRLPDDVRTAPEFYDAKTTWPAESLARWKACLPRR